MYIPHEQAWRAEKSLTSELEELRKVEVALNVFFNDYQGDQSSG